jgi:hypothetical protein
MRKAEIEMRFTFDNLARTNTALLLWSLGSVVLGILIYWLSEMPLLKSLHLELWALPTIAPLPVALAFASWTLNNRARTLSESTRRFWGPFADNCTIILPSFEPIRGVGDGLDDPSPFTPYHDAVASSEIQSFLRHHFGSETQVHSSREFSGLQGLGQKNLIVLGGSNFNNVTDELMSELWKRIPGQVFHWSKTVHADSAASALVSHSQDHFLQIGHSDAGVNIMDEIRDVPCPSPGQCGNARGMVIRIKSFLQDGHYILIVGGADCAQGTLAAARFCLDPEQLSNLPDTGYLQVIVSCTTRGYNITGILKLRELSGNLPS